MPVKMKSFMVVVLALFISAYAEITNEDRENIKTYLINLANELSIERQTVETNYKASVNQLRKGTPCVERACDEYLKMGLKNIDSSLGELIKFFEETADDASSEEAGTLEIAKASIKNGFIASEVETMKKALNIEIDLNLKKLKARLASCQ